MNSSTEMLTREGGVKWVTFCDQICACAGYIRDDLLLCDAPERVGDAFSYLNLERNAVIRDNLQDASANFKR